MTSLPRRVASAYRQLPVQVWWQRLRAFVGALATKVRATSLKDGWGRARALATKLGHRLVLLGAAAVAHVRAAGWRVGHGIAAGAVLLRGLAVAYGRVLGSVALFGLAVLIAVGGTKVVLSLAAAACLVVGAWLGWRRLAAGEHRESLDVDEMLATRSEIDGAAEGSTAGPTWSASAEAGCVVEDAPATDVEVVDAPPAEVLDLTAVGVRDRCSPISVAPPADWVPALPLPGEPDEPIPMPSFGGQAGRLPVAGFVPDAYTALLERRDAVAEQVADAFAELHRLRTETLRRAAQAELNAELATSARNRAARIVRDTRRQQHEGRTRPEEVPDSEDAFDDVHRFRTEALRQAAQAEHGAEGVARARDRANRLLAEQRKIEAELRKIAPRRFVG